MANINTKIILANDTLARWNKSSRVLNAGEVALATTDKGVQVHIGDGKIFSAGTKTLDLSGLTTYAVTTKLSNDTTVQAAVDALNTKVGTESVATQINNAITALASADVAVTDQFVTAVSQTNGKITVSRAAILSSAIPTIPQSTVEGLATELAKIDTKSTVKIGEGTAEATQSDLAIHKVTPEQYAAVLTGTIPTSDLYIVESEDGHIDALSQRIQNVAEGTVSSDAATFGQLSALSVQVGSVATDALTSVTDTGTGVVSKIEKSEKDVSVTRTSLTGTVTIGTGLNAISSITLGDYGQVTSVAGFKAVQTVAIGKDTTATDVAARYVLSVDGVSCTTTIDIPKDKVVKSAYVVDVKGLKTEGETPELTAFQISYDGAVKKTVVKANEPELFAAINQAYSDTTGKKGAGDGKYIRITVSDDESALPVYIAVPELVDSYTAQQNATQVQLNISDSHVISAAVVAGSIGTTELSASAVTTDKVADNAITPAKMSTASTDTFVFDCGDSGVAD